jgi:hypothetical protein
MNPEFHEQVIKGHQADPRWSRVLAMLEAEATLLESERADLPYEKDNNGLLWSIETPTGLRRLCIPRSVVKDVLKLAHGAYDRTMARLHGLAIYQMSKLVLYSRAL